jgi:hypothetical protein
MTSARWLRWLAWSLLLVVLSGALLTGRMVSDGEQALRESDRAFHRGDVRTAAQHARRAAVLYAPGAPHVERAYARLKAIAAGAEAAGDRTLAETAWRSVRGAALETRHLFSPRQADLEQANANLARLAKSADIERHQAEKWEQDRLAMLAGSGPPRAIWACLVSLGFAMAGAGLGLVGWRGVAPDGTLGQGRAVWLGSVLTAIGAACWTSALLWS